MKYRKKPIEVEAVQWTGENLEETEKSLIHDIIDIAKGRPYKLIVIKTLKGNMIALEGDYIIKTYEEVEDNETLHRKMWNDIAKGKVDSKREWLEKYCKGETPYNGCFACEEAKSREGEEGNCYCYYCPITPVKEDLCCGGLFLEYDQLREEGNLREAAYYAGLIRDLPWDKNVKKEEKDI